MAVSISEFVAVTVSLEGAAAERFSFGKLCGVFTHAVAGATRFMGPYASVAEAEAAGFTAAAVPEANAWLNAVFGQDASVDEVYIGQRVSPGDSNWTDTLTAVGAVAGPDGFYGLNIESRVEADILLAAAWAESNKKLFIAQSNDVLGVQETDVTFAGVTNNAGDYSIRVQYGTEIDITVTYTSAGSQTSAQIATQLIAAWDADDDAAALADASAGGSGVVTLTFLEPGRNYTVTAAGVAGTASPSTVQAATGDIGSQLNLLGYTRTALLFHASDDSNDGDVPSDGYACGAWSSRCLGGFDLDSPGGVGTWAFKQLSGITPDEVTGSAASDFFEVKTNLYHRLKGLSFTSKGTVARGWRLDLVTSLDWLRIRNEEAVLSEFVGESHKIPYTSAGISRLVGVVQNVLEKGVSCGHLSPDHPRLVVAPKIREVSSADKINRTLTLSATCTLAGAIEAITFPITVEQ
jgi:hypothetical protein